MSNRPAFWIVKLTHLTKHRDLIRATLCDCHVSTPTVWSSGNLTITNIVSSRRSHMLLQEIPEILNGIQIRTVSWPFLSGNKRNIAVAQPLLSQVRFVFWSTVLHKKKRFITHKLPHFSDQMREKNIAIISSLDWLTNDKNRRRHPMSCDCGLSVTVMIRTSKFLKRWHRFDFSTQNRRYVN